MKRKKLRKLNRDIKSIPKIFHYLKDIMIKLEKISTLVNR